MHTTERNLVIGVFEEPARAPQALAELRRLGFHEDQVRLTTEGAAAGAVMASLVGLGLPDESARWYAHEVQVGRTLVIVFTEDHFNEAFAVLRRHGAYDLENGPTGARDMPTQPTPVVRVVPTTAGSGDATNGPHAHDCHDLR